MNVFASRVYKIYLQQSNVETFGNEVANLILIRNHNHSLGLYLRGLG